MKKFLIPLALFFVLVVFLAIGLKRDPKEIPSPLMGRVAQIGTLFYFGFFLLMPWWSRIGEPKPVPERVTFKAH